MVEGRVVGISDGDTITVLDDSKSQHKCRIAGIDAPEKGQAFGERSGQNLADITHGKDARLECYKIDRFGREVCKVWVQALSVGLAWWFRRYSNEQSPEERGRYSSEEEEARSRKRGLWADDRRVPPWEWRAARATSR